MHHVLLTQNNMHPSLIQEGEELEKKATGGKWEELYDGNDPDNGLCDMISDHDDEVISMNSRIGDCEFIVWARNNTKELLEAARWAVENGYKGV